MGNLDIVLDASEELCLEINEENTKYWSIFRHKNAGQRGKIVPVLN
jgi:hypothetical protein